MLNQSGHVSCSRASDLHDSREGTLRCLYMGACVGTERWIECGPFQARVISMIICAHFILQTVYTRRGHIAICRVVLSSGHFMYSRPAIWKRYCFHVHGQSQHAGVLVTQYESRLLALWRCEG